MGRHAGYDAPDSWLSQRLVSMRERVRLALDDSPPGRPRVISLCAGQGRDLLGVLADHPRRGDGTARRVEPDPRNVAAARAAAPPGVEVVVGGAAGHRPPHVHLRRALPVTA